MKRISSGRLARDLACTAVLANGAQDRKIEEVIPRLQSAIAGARPPIVCVLEALLANWYWA